jgi:hypothetical protein
MATFNPELRRVLASGLKAARLRANLGSSEAARELTRRGLNCQRGTLLAWERGYGTTSREPYASDLPVIASLYGCGVSDFFNPPVSAEELPRVLYSHPAAAAAQTAATLD